MLPLALCATQGALTTSLWLDEITYHYYETDMALRARDLARPNSALSPFASVFAFCDLQRLLHAVMNLTSLSQRIPIEISLRMTSVVCFVLLIALTSWIAVQRSERPAHAQLATLLAGTSPILLYFAFEARVYALTALLAVSYAAAINGERTLPAWRKVVALLLGLVLVRSNFWSVCIPLAFLAWEAARLLRVRSFRFDPLLFAAMVAPVGIAGAEWLFIRLTQDPSSPPFPLFRPSGIARGMHLTALAAIPVPLRVPLVSTKVAILCTVTLLAGFAIWTAAHELRSRTFSVAGIGLLSLSLSAIAGGWAGNIVYGRHQAVFWALILVGIAISAARGSSGGRIVLLVVHVLLLPGVIVALRERGNGRDIAQIVRTESPAGSTPALVVQHTLRLGYPDPLNAAGANYYLNERADGRAIFPMFELPTHRPIAKEHGVYRYFNGGAPLFAAYAERPVGDWVLWLQHCPHNVLWVAWPRPMLDAEKGQTESYWKALSMAGYFPASGQTYALDANPPSVLQRFDLRANRRSSPPVGK